VTRAAALGSAQRHVGNHGDVTAPLLAGRVCANATDAIVVAIRARTATLIRIKSPYEICLIRGKKNGRQLCAAVLPHAKVCGGRLY